MQQSCRLPLHHDHQTKEKRRRKNSIFTRGDLLICFLFHRYIERKKNGKRANISRGILFSSRNVVLKRVLINKFFPHFSCARERERTNRSFLFYDNGNQRLTTVFHQTYIGNVH